MITKAGTVLKLTAESVKEGVRAQLFVNNEIVSASFSIYDSDEKFLFSGDMNLQNKTAETIAVFEAEDWSIERPILYTFSAKVTYSDGSKETIRDRFGFRRLSADEKYLYLNGYPFYMRAYIRGAAAHEHQNNCGLSEYDFYKKNILMAKSYGFNTIRFHSVVPPEECFRVADELGIMIHIEMRAEKQEYDNLKEMLYGKNDFISNQFP